MNSNDNHHVSPAPIASSSRESLVQDERAGLTPAQMVERKLASLLRSTPLPVSQMKTSERRRALS